ncbi:MAG: serine hydrolase [Pseudohongiellaceae bacterium]
MSRKLSVVLFMLTAGSSIGASAQWSGPESERIEEFYASLDSAALVVLHRGETVLSLGDVSGKYNVASIRKSLLNSLFGVGWDRGWIELDRNLAEIGIDDTDPPLSDQEKTATVEDLLRSRSGVYHRSLYEAGWWDLMPEPGTYPPGEYWIYNNWDFNTLGTIWELESGQTIHAAFQRYIAEPMGLRDFEPNDVEYITRRNLAERMRGNTSDHQLYLFMMSARDLATFGQLYLQGGEWQGQQILSAEWIKRSFNGLPTEFGSGSFNTHYGYLWWVEKGSGRRFPVPSITAPAYAATGSRGHLLYLIPACDLVIAHTSPTRGGAGALAQITRRFFGSGEVTNTELTQLLELIVKAHPSPGCAIAED